MFVTVAILSQSDQMSYNEELVPNLKEQFLQQLKQEVSSFTSHLSADSSGIIRPSGNIGLIKRVSFCLFLCVYVYVMQARVVVYVRVHVHAWTHAHIVYCYIFISRIPYTSISVMRRTKHLTSVVHVVWKFPRMKQ